MTKKIGLLILLIFQSSLVLAKTMSSATIQLQGVVQEVASVSTTSLRSDLDLRPGTSVIAAKIGQIQIKANSEISGIFLSSNTKSGTLENGNNQPFKFSRPFTLKVNRDCKSLKTDAGIVLSAQEKNIATSKLTQFADRRSSEHGIVENCDLSASWSSEKIAQAKPTLNSGLYSMSITVTLVSQ